MVNFEDKTITMYHTITSSAAAASSGILISIDDFYKEYVDTHQLAHGFINTEVGEGHLNEIGHSLVAKRLGDAIKEH